MNKKNLKAVLDYIGVRNLIESPEKIISGCPFAPFFHKNSVDAHPSFAVFVNEDGYSGFCCKACGRKGTIKSLVASLGKLSGRNFERLISRIDAIEFTVNVDISVTEKEKFTPLNIDEPYFGFRSVYSNQECMDYLKKRNVKKRAIDIISIVCDPLDRRVVFPVFDRQKNLFGFTGRDYTERSPIRIKDYKGFKKKFFLLGIEQWEPKRPIVLVEGLFGYAHLIGLGIDNDYNVGCTLGASSLSDEKAELIKDFNAPVHFLYDNDKGGDLGLFGDPQYPGKNDGAVHRLKNYTTVFVPSWPEGKKQPDELVKSEIYKMLNNTLPFTY